MHIEWADNLLPGIALLPLLGGMMVYLSSARIARLICSGTVILNLALVVMVSLSHAEAGKIAGHAMGGWSPPLGIILRVDGLSLLLLWITAISLLAVAAYSYVYFSRHQPVFWALLLALLGGINALAVSGDLFNIYITLELLTFCAVALAGWGDNPESRQSALRYLFTSASGSLCYLLGVGLLYLRYSTLDIVQLSSLVIFDPVTKIAFSFVSLGVLMKAAGFPFHFWLPATHAAAVSPVSALLSAIVIKAPLYVLVRIWSPFFAQDYFQFWAYLFTISGCLAVLWGGIQSVLSSNIKQLIAYSTVAQVGYILLALSLVDHSGDTQALSAVYFFVLSHAVAKTALFLAAGSVVKAAGSTDLRGLTGAATRMPLTIGAIAFAGISLIGLPPSIGFVAKWQLMTEAVTGGNWIIVIVVAAGTLFAAGYVYRMISLAFDQSVETSADNQWHEVPRALQVIPLMMAVLSLMLGFTATFVLELLL